jgi:hypothetical protein
MVMELVDTNFMAGELENNFYNCFQVMVPEELHSGHPYLDQLVDPVQNEGGQSNMLYYGFFFLIWQ